MGTGGAGSGPLPSLTDGGAGAGGADPTGGAGGLPGLTGDPSAGAGAGAATGGAGTAAAGQAGAAGTQPGAAGAMPFDINGLASTGRWLGPVMTIGGGAMAIKGFSMSSAAAAAAAAGVQGAGKAGGLWKWGGIGLALGGLALTGLGFKAKGLDTGKKATEQEAVAALNEMSNQAQAAMQAQAQQAQSQISTLQQQLAALQQQGVGTGGAGPGATGQTPGAQGQTPGAQGQQTYNPNAPAINPQTGEPIQGTGQPVGVGAASTIVPGAGQQAGTPVTGGTPGAGGTTGTPGATTGQWSAQSLIGRSVNLAAGNSASGTVIAEPGNYRIEANAGDPNGYATLDEANAAARETMSTELMGSKFLRWMVVEHNGRYYGAIAKQMGQQDQAQPLDAATGNVVAWSAMNHVLDNGQNGWQAYSWSSTGGAQAMAVPYGTNNVFGGGVGGGGPVSGGTASAPVGGGAGSAPSGAGTVTGGGPVTGGGSFDPAGEVGRTFSLNATTTAEGDVAQGGVVQLQKFVASSTGGFGSAEEAAAAARSARKAAGGGDQWKRWVTMQGTDGRFYVYEGSIVKRETAPLAAAAPMHVFGSNFAEYFDGGASSWKALRDAA
jgi:hypothetical protein